MREGAGVGNEAHGLPVVFQAIDHHGRQLAVLEGEVAQEGVERMALDAVGQGRVNHGNPVAAYIGNGHVNDIELFGDRLGSVRVKTVI